MKLISSFLFFSVLLKLISTTAAVAQVTADDTTSTTVTPTDTGVQIDNGERAEGNLFHSFEQFSIPTGNEAFFNNASDIVNIFSRVTGGNISNIDGLIRANGTANLFLINPAGIVLGENARLQLGGSFYGSTADSIVFGNGEFSATDLNNPPLITINAPIGLGFRDNSGEITVRGDGLGTRASNNRASNNNDLIDTENALRVNSSSTLGLVGGNLNLEGATLKTDGGRIELGSVAGNGQVSLTPIEQGFSLGYEGVENWGDVQLSQSATVDASGLVSGDIRVEGNRITLTEGSQIEASTLSNLPSLETPGMIEINATDTINIDGENSQGLPSWVVSNVNPGAVGNAGDITITTGNLNLTNGAVVSASIFGQGNAGLVEITATDTINIEGNIEGNIDGENSNSQGFPGGAGSVVGPEAMGDSGGVTITTGNLNLTNGGRVDASTLGQGDAGLVEITATDTINIDGEDSNGFPSGAFSGVGRPEAVGDAGGVTITTGNLTLTNGGRVGASILGQGDAGLVEITASDTINIDGANSQGTPSAVASQAGLEAVGDAGGVTITTGNLNLTNRGKVTAGTFSEGNAGRLTIQANSVSLDNNAVIETIAVSGTGGVIDLQIAENLTLNNSLISASTFFLDGEEAGRLTIQANSVSLDNNAKITASTASGTGGIIDLQIAEDLTLRNNSLISASAFEGANGGNLDINARFIIAFLGNDNVTNNDIFATNNDIIASAEQGQGGNISITAQALFGIEQRPQNPATNDIDASSDFGLDGTIGITTTDNSSLRETAELSDNALSTETIAVSNICSVSDRNQVSNFIVKGKGGVMPEPTEALTDDALIIDEELATSNRPQTDGNQESFSESPLDNGSDDNSDFKANNIPSHVQPVAYKDNGEPVYLARGLIKQEDGTVILTALPTASAQSRTLENFVNCSQ